jgi:hypothetical protein
MLQLIQIGVQMRKSAWALIDKVVPELVKEDPGISAAARFIKTSDALRSPQRLGCSALLVHVARLPKLIPSGGDSGAS